MKQQGRPERKSERTLYFCKKVACQAQSLLHKPNISIQSQSLAEFMQLKVTIFFSQVTSGDQKQREMQRKRVHTNPKPTGSPTPTRIHDGDNTVLCFIK